MAKSFRSPDRSASQPLPNAAVMIDLCLLGLVGWLTKDIQRHG